jgi:hypothetical protein
MGNILSLGTFVLLSCENTLSLGVFNFVLWQVLRF